MKVISEKVICIIDYAGIRVDWCPDTSKVYFGRGIPPMEAGHRPTEDQVFEYMNFFLNKP